MGRHNRQRHIRWLVNISGGGGCILSVTGSIDILTITPHHQNHMSNISQLTLTNLRPMFSTRKFRKQECKSMRIFQVRYLAHITALHASFCALLCTYVCMYVYIYIYIIYIYIKKYYTEIHGSTYWVTKLSLQPIYNIITSGIHVSKCKTHQYFSSEK